MKIIHQMEFNLINVIQSILRLSFSWLNDIDSKAKQQNIPFGFFIPFPRQIWYFIKHSHFVQFAFVVWFGTQRVSMLKMLFSTLNFWIFLNFFHSRFSLIQFSRCNIRTRHRRSAVCIQICYAKSQSKHNGTTFWASSLCWCY